MAQNEKRKGGKRKTDRKNIWKQLFLWKEEEFTSSNDARSVDQSISSESEEDQDHPSITIKRVLWSPWKIAAYIIFLFFLCFLVNLCRMLWTAEDISDISGYKNDNKLRNVADIIDNANHKEISITEEEINHYIKNSIFISHKGPISILAKTQNLAFRIHDGYGELIIDSSIGNIIPHSISIYLSFTREISQGEPQIKLAFRGGAPILSCIPIGGKCGQLPIPEKFILLFYPTLDEILKQFPKIQKLIQEDDYLPIFSKRGLRDEGRIILLAEQALQS